MPTDKLAKILWNYNKLNQKIEKADAIIVCGCYETRVAEHGADLFLDNFAPVIVFSGGLGRNTDGVFLKTEAQIFSEIAIKKGVPEDKIIIEDKSTNTEENLRFSIEELCENKVDFKKIILVHKPYMERRVYATWRKIFPEIEIFVTSPNISFEEGLRSEFLTKNEIISTIVGDMQRIKLYYEKGLLVKQEIPDNVWLAYEELVKRGFDSQLVK